MHTNTDTLGLHSHTSLWFSANKGCVILNQGDWHFFSMKKRKKKNYKIKSSLDFLRLQLWEGCCSDSPVLRATFVSFFFLFCPCFFRHKTFGVIIT